MADKQPLDLDLDALAPAEAEITFQGKVIKVAPLKVSHYAKIIAAGNEIGKLEKESDPNELTTAYEGVRELINEIVPELAEYNLSIPQLTAVYTLLAKMATPEDKALAALAEKNITVGSKEAKGGSSNPKA